MKTIEVGKQMLRGTYKCMCGLDHVTAVSRHQHGYSERIFYMLRNILKVHLKHLEPGFACHPQVDTSSLNPNVWATSISNLRFWATLPNSWSQNPRPPASHREPPKGGHLILEPPFLSHLAQFVVPEP